MPDIWFELRSAFRRLVRVPGFTALCVITLAVGIGATTAIFSVVHGVLLSPLPYPDAQALVGLWHRAPGLDMEQVPQSPGTYLFYRQQEETLESVALFSEIRLNLSSGDLPERVPAAAVTPSLSTVLRTPPTLGRAFSEAEGRPGGAPVVLLTDGIWKRRFAADPKIVGRTLPIDGVSRKVVGVLPPGFAFPRPETELWIPLIIDPVQAPLARFSSPGVGRLATGVSPIAAQNRLAGLLHQLEQAFPEDRAAPVLARAGFAPVVRPLRDDLVGDVGRTLWILLGAVGFLLLISCANVANLLLVRAEGQRWETALRSALGASRSQNLLGILAESLLMATGGGLLGVFLAQAGLRLLHQLRPTALPRLEEIALDGTVLATAAGVSLTCCLLVALLPAWRAGSTLPAAILGGGSAATGLRIRIGGRQLLVAIQVALAVVLLIGSGLMLRSFVALSSLDPGFEPEGAWTFQLALPRATYPDDTAAAGLYHQVLDLLHSVPGIESIGSTSSLPLGGTAQAIGHVVEGFPVEEGAPPPVFDVERVSDGYFSALGIPILSGRSLERGDTEHRSGVVVVNEVLARRFWPTGEAIGQRLRPSHADGDDPWYTVVGVAGNVRSRRLTEEPREIVYYPLLGKAPGAWSVDELSMVVRSPMDLEAVLPAVREKVRSLAPGLPVAEARTMLAVLTRARARMSFTLLMLGLATAVALLLATVGTYGFVTYLASQRRLEFGVRMTAGAVAGDIRRLVLAEGLRIALVGVALGLVGAWWLTRWIGDLLFEVAPLDPLVFAAVAVLLVLVVLASSLRPASWAARLDPVSVLRPE